MPRIILAAIVAAALFATTGCGGGGDHSGAPSTTSTQYARLDQSPDHTRRPSSDMVVESDPAGGGTVSFDSALLRLDVTGAHDGDQVVDDSGNTYVVNFTASDLTITASDGAIYHWRLTQSLG